VLHREPVIAASGSLVLCEARLVNRGVTEACRPRRAGGSVSGPIDQFGEQCGDQHPHTGRQVPTRCWCYRQGRSGRGLSTSWRRRHVSCRARTARDSSTTTARRNRPWDLPLRGPHLQRLAPPRHPRLPRPRLLHPRRPAPRPKRHGTGLSLYRIVRELHHSSPPGPAHAPPATATYPPAHRPDQALLGTVFRIS
jgi:hypothetical protein